MGCVSLRYTLTSETASQKIAKSRNIFGYFAVATLQKAINALLLLQNKSQMLSANLLTAAPSLAAKSVHLAPKADGAQAAPKTEGPPPPPRPPNLTS